MHFFCKKHPFYFAGSENLCTFVVNLVMSISNGATVVDRTYQDNNNNLKFNFMIKLISKQQPMTKIGTKEKELKYVLNLVLSGSISEKEVIEFACKHTGMQPTMVKAAIESCLQIVELYIALGYSVKLGDLGTFYPTIDSKAVDSNTEAGLSQLKKVNIRFRPNSELVEKVNKADKELKGVFKIVDYERKFYEEVGRKDIGDTTDDTAGNDGNGNSDGGGGGSSSGGDLEG